MAGANVAWNAALTRCGYDAVSIAFLGTAGGIGSVEELRSIAVTEVAELVRGLSKSATYTPLVAGQVRPSFSFIRGKKLQAFRVWISYREARGQNFGSALFTNAEITRWTIRINDLAVAKADDATLTLSEPTKLKDFEKWELWEELFTTYLAHVRNSELGTPFTYLTRDETPAVPIQTAAQREAELLLFSAMSVDEDLSGSSLHNGASFDRDNHKLFDIIKGLTIEGTCWTFIERYKISRNGRAAFLQLQKQASGPGAVTLKRNKAYHMISTAHFNGRGNFTLERYISIHQDGHNRLSSTGEPVPETKKVTDFLNGIQHEDLKYAKAAIQADPNLHGTFDEAQRYVTQAYTSTDLAKKANGRRIASLEQSHKAPLHHGKGTKQRSKQPFNKGGKQKYPHLSMDKWHALTDDEKKAYTANRRKEIIDGKSKRRISKVVTTPPTPPAIDYAQLAAAVASRTIGAVGNTHEKEVTELTPQDIAKHTKALHAQNAKELVEFQQSQKVKFDAAKALFDAARLKSAGGQFGRNGTKTSFPKSAIAAAKAVGISAVITEPTPIVSFATVEEATKALSVIKASDAKAITDPGLTDSETEVETIHVSNPNKKRSASDSKSPLRCRRLPTAATSKVKVGAYTDNATRKKRKGDK
jgi:hypothetical protein